jgi:transketolase
MIPKLADCCAHSLAVAARTDRRIWVLDGDLADSDGAAIFARDFADRFIMSGIAEQCMVSMAAGMASCGLRPWVFSFASFLCYRAYDQVRVCISQARQPVTLVGSHSGGCTNRNGKTHAALNDMALMASLPHMNVWSPASAADVEYAVRQILDDAAPAYVRLPRRALPQLADPAICRWLTARSRNVIVSTGMATHLAVAACERLVQNGVDAGVLHCLKVSPPPALVLEAIDAAARVFVVEDHYRFAGLGSLLQTARPHVPVTVFGWPDDWAGQSGPDDDLLDLHGLSADRLAIEIGSAIALGRRGAVAASIAGT